MVREKQWLSEDMGGCNSLVDVSCLRVFMFLFFYFLRFVVIIQFNSLWFTDLLTSLANMFTTQEGTASSHGIIQACIPMLCRNVHL